MADHQGLQLMDEIDEAEIDLVCGESEFITSDMSVPLTVTDESMHHLSPLEMASTVKSFTFRCAPCLGSRTSDLLIGLTAPGPCPRSSCGPNLLCQPFPHLIRTRSISTLVPSHLSPSLARELPVIARMSPSRPPLMTTDQCLALSSHETQLEAHTS